MSKAKCVSPADLLLYWLSTTKFDAPKGFSRNTVEKALNGIASLSRGYWVDFMPLLRQGHVEVASAHEPRFRVSPPVLYWRTSATDESASWYGARTPATMTKLAEECDGQLSICEGGDRYPDLWTVRADRDTCREIARNMGVHFCDVPVMKYIARLPSVEDALSSLPFSDSDFQRHRAFVRRMSMTAKGLIQERLPRKGSISPGLYQSGGGDFPPQHWLVLREGEEARRLHHDETIQLARWHCLLRSGGAVSFDGSTLTLPRLNTIGLPVVLERLLAIATGGPDSVSHGKISFAGVDEETARHVLRIAGRTDFCRA